MTQIMNLLNLAPDIQEELLFLPLIERGRETLLERHLRPIMAESDWRKQRRMWREMHTHLQLTESNAAVVDEKVLPEQTKRPIRL